MKFDSSTLFVNTGRKPLGAMQKKKKANKNAIALAICVAIIAVLCVFVGLILHVWFNYNEEVKEPQKTVVSTSDAQKAEKDKETQKPQEKPKEEKKEDKKENPKSNYAVFGNKSEISDLADKAFSSAGGTYSYGIVTLSDDYTYIMNTDKLYNSAALGAFLMDYVSNAIYIGTFDYSTNVSGNLGRDLMTSAFSNGSVEAANLLIDYFGTDKLNAYFKEKGYKNTVFSGNIGSGEDSYTTTEDIIKLIRKINDNTTFFPYSDMYTKMKNNTAELKISKKLPAGAAVANVGFKTEDETFEAGIIHTSNGSFIFAFLSDGSEEEISAADTAAAQAVSSIYEHING